MVDSPFGEEGLEDACEKDGGEEAWREEEAVFSWNGESTR